MSEVPSGPNGQFEAIKDDIRKRRERDLRWDIYYQTEQDSDTTFSGAYVKRDASIAERLAMTRQQIERLIRREAIRELLTMPPQETPNQLAQIGETQVIYAQGQAEAPSINPSLS